MWIIFSLFLIIVSGYTEASNSNCDRPPQITCETEEFPRNFPATASEWRDLCRLYIPFLRCILETEERCKSSDYVEKNPRYFQFLNDALSNGIEHCDEDNSMYPVIVENLACVKPIFDNQTEECTSSYPGHNEMRKYANVLRSKEIIVFTHNRQERRRCLRGLYVFSCEAMKIENNCGRDALEAFIKTVYTRTWYLTKQCNDNMKEHLFGIVDVFKPEDVPEVINYEECQKSFFITCGVDDLPQKFPSTEEEFHQTCRVYIPYLKCVIGVIEKCHPLDNYETDPKLLEILYADLASSLERCDRDDPIHSVVVASLSCVKPIFDNFFSECLDSFPGYKELKKYADALHRKRINVLPKNKEEKNECLRGLYIYSCEALKIERNCGTDVLDAYMTFIYTRAYIFTGLCNGNLEGYLPEIVEVFKQEDFRK